MTAIGRTSSRERDADSRSKVFTERAFRSMMRSRFVPVESGPSATDAAALEVPYLAKRPEVESAWTFGLFAAVLHRLPDPAGEQAFTRSILAGTPPEDLVASLLDSPEARRGRAIDAPDLNTIFVVGAYLAALGRYPDPAGLEWHTRALAEGARPGDVLDSLLSSPEATSYVRFPPDPVPESLAIAEALQQVVLGRRPETTLTSRLTAEYEAGAELTSLVRLLLTGERNTRNRVRMALATGQLARSVRRHSVAILTLMEVRASREWQWRVDRASWSRQRDLAARLEALPGTLRNNGGPAADRRSGNTR
jgi:hypothetical protein